MSTKKYLSLERLAEYDALLKAKIAQDDAATLDAAKEYVDQKFDGHTHSWNDLADKPFGEEGSGDTIFNEELSGFVFSDIGGRPRYAKQHVCDISNSIDAFGTYIFNWDGIDYQLTDFVGEDGYRYFGNPDLGTTADSGDVPFLVIISPDGMSIETTDEGESHTIKISSVGSGSIKYLDEKYIPDTIARKSDLDASITNITNGDIVVKEAEHATSADSATTADSATSAESATKATQDGNGAVIADTYETKSDASAKLDEAKEYTDTLKTYVGTIPEGATATDVVGYIQEKTSGIASEGAMTELSNRVGIVEGKVATIEGDYLTSADKTELQTNIDTVSSAVELLTNGVDAETVDGVNDLIAYVNEHGTEVTGMKADIKANADALAELAPVAKTGSWNDLVDRPTKTAGGIEIQGPANMSGIANQMGLYKVSDLVPTINDFANGYTITLASGQATEYSFENVFVGDKNSCGVDYILQDKNYNFFIFPQDTTHPGSKITFTAGTYFQTKNNKIDYKLTIPGTEILDVKWDYIDGKPVYHNAGIGKMPIVKSVNDSNDPIAWECVEPFSKSWNDLTDRPLYEEVKKLKSYIEFTDAYGKHYNTTVAAGSNDISPDAYGDNLFIQQDEMATVMVVINGETYFSTVQEDDTGYIYYVGNPSMHDETLVDNGLPFVVVYEKSQFKASLFTLNDKVSRALEMYQVEFEIKQLDEKFIPDSIARVADQDAIVERIEAIETWHEGFEEITAEDINGLFA